MEYIALAVALIYVIDVLQGVVRLRFICNNFMNLPFNLLLNSDL